MHMNLYKNNEKPQEISFNTDLMDIILNACHRLDFE